MRCCGLDYKIAWGINSGQQMGNYCKGTECSDCFEFHKCTIDSIEGHELAALNLFVCDPLQKAIIEIHE